jgi:hypothetical protein
MKRIAIIVALLALALPGFAQQFEEKIDVNAVLLDVIVTDNKGNQILGLSKDDFVVKENGVAQEVDSVDYFTNRKLLDAREESAPFKVEQVRGPLLHLLLRQARRPQRAVGPALPGTQRGARLRPRGHERERPRRDRRSRRAPESLGGLHERQGELERALEDSRASAKVS